MAEGSDSIFEMSRNLSCLGFGGACAPWTLDAHKQMSFRLASGSTRASPTSCTTSSRLALPAPILSFLQGIHEKVGHNGATRPLKTNQVTVLSVGQGRSRWLCSRCRSGIVDEEGQIAALSRTLRSRAVARLFNAGPACRSTPGGSGFQRAGKPAVVISRKRPSSSRIRKMASA